MATVLKSPKHILCTGAKGCYDASGKQITCNNSGQDAEYNLGVTTAKTRFSCQRDVVHDLLTGLYWPRRTDVFTYPLSWNETLDAVIDLNKSQYLGYSDWRLPNRRELRSLICHGARMPALPEDHPFLNVFLGWYWTSTTSAKASAYAWRVHLEGGRMFYGGKNDPSMGWPVRGKSTVLAQTGQQRCFDALGEIIECGERHQDGALRAGVQWPKPRFNSTDDGILDRLTGLIWAQSTSISGLLDWQGALDAIQELNRSSKATWRLPNINELESLVDASSADPALPSGHSFIDVEEAYWSSTTSFFETDWAYALYLHKGAVGVGFKRKADFYCWPVTGPL